MDFKKKMVDVTQGAPFYDLSPDKQADYLSLVAARGAADALKAIGLNDPDAAEDIKDIRALLRALRTVRKTAWATTLSAVGRVIGWAVVLGLAALFLNGKGVRDIATIIGH